MESSRLQRWQRIAQITVDSDEVRALRAAITALAHAPDELERRGVVRALARDSGLELPLPAFLIAEAYAQGETRVVAGLRDETAHAYKMIGESQTADDPSDHDRVAFSSYLVGDWAQTAELLVGLAEETSIEDRIVYLRAAGRLFHNTGHNDRAMEAFRAIVMRRPSDVDALMMLATMINSPAITPFMISLPASAPSEMDDDLDDETVIGVGVVERTPAPIVPRPPARPVPVRTTREPRSTLKNRSLGTPTDTPVLATVDDSELDEKLAKAFSDDDPPTVVVATTPSEAESASPVVQEARIPSGAPVVANVIAAARAWAASGDVDGAVQRLHAFIQKQPHVLASHLALVDLLRTNDRLTAAAEHLQKVLASGDLPPKHRAALLHRRAIIITALGGDANATHETLREAYALDSNSFALTLAFGMTSYTRKSWDDAARCLGSIAKFPQAAKHGGAVTRALVHAAIAELHRKAPDRAKAHCEAALALDAGHKPAVRILAMIAADRAGAAVDRDTDHDKTVFAPRDADDNSATLIHPTAKVDEDSATLIHPSAREEDNSETLIHPWAKVDDIHPTAAPVDDDTATTIKPSDKPR